jgi:NHL repeat
MAATTSPHRVADNGMSRRGTTLTRAVTLASAVLLICAPQAAGFGFIAKWPVRGASGLPVKPIAAATDRAGHVYVVGDFGQVLKFSARGTLITRWGRNGSAKGQLLSPSGIATDRAGHVYVANAGDHRIEKFTGSGRFLTQWRARGSGLGHEPTSVATDRGGHVYVGVKKWIEKFSAKGTFLTKWTDRGPGGLDFDATVGGIAAGAGGNLYVAGGARVTEFTSDGGFVLAWGKDVGGPGVDVCTVTCAPASQVGKGAAPEPGGFAGGGLGGIAIDGAGHVFVADGFLHRVQEFAADGVYLSQFGAYGGGNGRFRAPAGLATNARGDLYVVDHNNFRIQVFGERG